MKEVNVHSAWQSLLRGSSMAAVVAASVSGMAANAQTATPAPASQGSVSTPGIADIIVTAQKRAESLQKVPVAVTALNQAALEKMQIQNFGNLSGVAPNVISVVSASGSNPQITIRGIIGGNVEPGRDSGVALYLDGVYISRTTGAQFDVADLERVEVLRGPQGTLYGRNATGGAINYISAAPKGELYARQEVTIGNYGEIRSKTRLDLPKIGDFSISLNFLHDQRNGYVRNSEAGHTWDFTTPSSGLLTGQRTSPDTLGARNSDAGFVAVHYAPAAIPLTVDYHFDITHATYTNGAQQVLYDPTTPYFGITRSSPADLDRQDAVPMGFTTPETLNVFGHNLTATYNATDHLQFKSITGYRGYTDRYSADVVGGGFATAVNPADPAQNYFEPLGIISYERDRSFSEEAQASFKSDVLDAIGGAYYFQQHTRTLNPLYAFQYLTPPDLPAPLSITDADNHNRSIAVFGQATAHLTKQLDVTGGIRSTWDRRESQGTVTDTPQFLANFHHVDWTANVTYRPTGNLNFYAKAGSGYLTGGIFNQLSFQPETLVQYEAGAKLDLLDRRLRFDVAAFRSNYNNLQESSNNPNPPFLYQTFNVGKARITGFEIEATAKPIDILTLTANYGYSDFKYLSFILPGVGDVTNVANEDFYRPKNTLGLGADLALPALAGGIKPSFSVDGQWHSNMSLYLLPTTYYFGPSSAFVDNYTHKNAFWNVDARMTFAEIAIGRNDLKGKFSVWTRNLLDKKTIVNATSIPATLVAGQFNLPRTFGFDFGIQFR